jgi:hypothetical protein
VAAPAVDDADAAKVALLARLGGIGTELATVLVREAPVPPLREPQGGGRLCRAHAQSRSPAETGTESRASPKAGNPLLRKSMVELAWLWLRYQPGSALARWFTERVGDDPRPHPQDHRRRPGQEAAGRPVALRHHRAGTRRRAPEASRDLNDEVRPAPPSGASCRAGVVRDRSSTGFNKPSPKMGPTTPSRPALNEASWWEPRVPPDTSDAAGLRCLCPAHPRPTDDENGDAACTHASYESSSYWGRTWLWALRDDGSPLVFPRPLGAIHRYLSPRPPKPNAGDRVCRTVWR